ISQVEYYQLLAVLKPVYNPEQWTKPQNRHLPDVSSAEKDLIERHNAETDRRVAELNGQIAAVRRPYEKKLVEGKLATLPEAIRADTAAALETPAEKRSAIQKYLADRLGPMLKVAPEEVMRSLSEAERGRIGALSEQVAALKAGKRSFGKLQA